MRFREFGFGRIVSEAYSRELTINNLRRLIIMRFATEPTTDQAVSWDRIYGHKKDTNPMTPGEMNILNSNIETVVEKAEAADPWKGRNVPFLILSWVYGGLQDWQMDIDSVGADLLDKLKDLSDRRKVPDSVKQLNLVYKGLKPNSPSELRYLWTKGKNIWQVVEAKINQAYSNMLNQDDESAKHKSAIKGDYDVTFSNNTVTVVHVKDKTASCFWGMSTRWCTASKNANRFNQYNKQGNLYVIAPKQPNTYDIYDEETDEVIGQGQEKYQMFVGTDVDGQHIDFRDEQDSIITDTGVDYFWETLNKFGINKENVDQAFPGFAKVDVTMNTQLAENIKNSLKNYADYTINQAIQNAQDDNYDNYLNWLQQLEKEDDQEYVDDDGAVKDDAPSYLEYDDALRTEINHAQEYVNNFDIFKVQDAWLEFIEKEGLDPPDAPILTPRYGYIDTALQAWLKAELDGAYNHLLNSMADGLDLKDGVITWNNRSQKLELYKPGYSEVNKPNEIF